MSGLSDEITCELLQALINIDDDETPHEAFSEAWDVHREGDGPFDQAVRDLYGRGLVEAREMRERVYEVGNDRPMVSSEIVVEGITAAGRAFIEQHGT
ncbi:MAG: hypothetical protein ACOYXW_18170 [Actinomycetota bacterium]